MGLTGQNSSLYQHPGSPQHRGRSLLGTPACPPPPADPLSPPYKALQERRARCETQNIDPVVWTNQRVLKWVRDIDLKVRGWWAGLGGICKSHARCVSVLCEPALLPKLVRMPAPCCSRRGSTQPSPTTGPPFRMPFS